MPLPRSVCRLALPPPHFLCGASHSAQDVLLRAYFDEFNASDAVVLYLRTATDADNKRQLAQFIHVRTPMGAPVHARTHADRHRRSSPRGQA
eukprot:3998650-Pleurochrysis_carterae.AAC.1